MANLTRVLFATLRVSTPLLLAAMGGALSLQASILNITVEGVMLSAAFTAIAASAFSGTVWIGLVAAVVVSVLVAAVFGVFVIDLKAKQMVAGLAINLLASGLTAYLLVVMFAARGAYTPVGLQGLPGVRLPIIHHIPVLGEILSGHGMLVYVSWLSVLVTAVLLYRTHLGVYIRAVGEHEEAAETAGIPVRRVKYAALLIGAIFSGLAGVQLSVGDLVLFGDNMSGGRGYIALAAVFFGAAHPVVTALGCLLFGLFEAVQFRLQAATQLPPQFPQMLPSLVVLGVLSIMALRRELQRRSL